MDKKIFKKGIIDGIPIGAGYFAVAFSLGIAAAGVGLNAIEGFFASLFTIASAGEYAAFRGIGTNITYIEMGLLILVTNGRYFLMSCAMSQRVSKTTKLIHRIGIGAFITDEIFGISIGQEGYLKPEYTYGAAIASVPAWAMGTALGIIAGNVLPPIIVTSLGVALYGMFLAIIIPPAKKDRIVLLGIIISFIASYCSKWIPYIKEMTEGTKIIILTVVISAALALIFPKKETDNEK